MFNRHSIFFVLTLSFVLTVAVVVATLVFLLSQERKHYMHNVQMKYFPISRMVQFEYFTHGFRQDFENSIANMGLELIKDKAFIDDVLYSKDTKLIFVHKEPYSVVALFSDGTGHYLHVQSSLDEFMVVDTNSFIQRSHTIIVALFIAILGVLFVLAYMIYKKLRPLYTITAHIKALGDENFEVFTAQAYQKDEVSLLAQQLQNSAHNLKQIKHARNVFIRNIMHELKTPITKGKFLIELPYSEANKARMQKVFYRLESLINEFASIEELIAKHKVLQTKSYFLEDIIDNALDMLFDDKTTIDIRNSSISINVNFKLFSIALKNLIDNAKKYTKDSHVKIEATKEYIDIINSAPPLENSLEAYYEPFHNSDTKEHDGFGLGLYIVYHIVKAHHFTLQYHHQKGENIFRIVFELQKEEKDKQ